MTKATTTSMVSAHAADGSSDTAAVLVYYTLTGAATVDRGSASGIYLASYFVGGLVGSIVLGQLYMRFAWPGCVAGIGASLALASVLAVGLRKMKPAAAMMRAAGSDSRLKVSKPRDAASA